MTIQEVINLLNGMENIEWAIKKEDVSKELEDRIKREDGFFYFSCNIVCKTTKNNHLYIIYYSGNNDNTTLRYVHKNKNILKVDNKTKTSERLYPNLDKFKSLILYKGVYIVLFTNTKIDFNGDDGFKSKILLVNNETIEACIRHI